MTKNKKAAVKKKTPYVKKDMCIECAYCDLKVDFFAGSHYTCLKLNKDLPSAMLDRQACAAFTRPKTGTQWGP